MELPLDRFLNLVYHYATDGADEKERNKFDVRLNMPIPGVVRSRVVTESSPWSSKNEAAALGNLAAALGQKG